jgi:hypothetical protein
MSLQSQAGVQNGAIASSPFGPPYTNTNRPYDSQTLFTISSPLKPVLETAQLGTVLERLAEACKMIYLDSRMIASKEDPNVLPVDITVSHGPTNLSLWGTNFSAANNKIYETDQTTVGGVTWESFRLEGTGSNPNGASTTMATSNYITLAGNGNEDPDELMLYFPVYTDAGIAYWMAGRTNIGTQYVWVLCYENREPVPVLSSGAVPRIKVKTGGSVTYLVRRYDSLNHIILPREDYNTYKATYSVGSPSTSGTITVTVLLSQLDWSTFGSKINPSDFVTMPNFELFQKSGSVSGPVEGQSKSNEVLRMLSGAVAEVIGTEGGEYVGDAAEIALLSISMAASLVIPGSEPFVAAGNAVLGPVVNTAVSTAVNAGQCALDLYSEGNSFSDSIYSAARFAAGQIPFARTLFPTWSTTTCVID